jgi:hypothetical protein
MFLRRAALVTAVSLAGSLFSAAAVTATTTGPRNHSLAGQVIVQGRLLGGDRKAAASGIRVSLYAWPNSQVLKALRPGEQVPWKLVGSTVTTASSSYRISITSPTALLSSVTKSGVVNLQVISTSNAGFGSFNFSRRIAPSGDGGFVVENASSDNDYHVISAQAVNLRLSTSHWKANASNAPDHCTGWLYRTSYGPEWDIVGQTYVNYSGITQGFTYHAGQSSTLGVGISSTNKSGSFTGDGTTSESSSTAETYPTRGPAYVYYQTEFVYANYEDECTQGNQWEARSDGYAGGAQSAFTSKPPVANYCVNQEAGSTFTKSTTTAVTWTNGLSIPVIGLSLSSHTGYDSGASLTFHFTGNHRMCGTGGYPGGTPYQLDGRE